MQSVEQLCELYNAWVGMSRAREDVNDELLLDLSRQWIYLGLIHTVFGIAKASYNS